jgi:hypothetical protein
MTNNAKRLLLGLLTCAALIAVSVPAGATPITGTLQLGGTFTIGPTFLSFCATAGPCPTAPGNWNVPGNGTGDLSAPYASDPNGGLITNLNSITEPVGTLLAGNGIQFLIFANSGALLTPDIDFFLTEVFAGVGTNAACGLAPAPGEVCTPTGSAATLINGAGGDSSATITMQGWARRISTGELSNLQMVFTSQFNTPFQSVLSTLASSGSVTNTFSASFSASPVPEPVTSMLVGSGLLALGLLRRRKRR